MFESSIAILILSVNTLYVPEILRYAQEDTQRSHFITSPKTIINAHLNRSNYFAPMLGNSQFPLFICSTKQKWE